MVASCPQCVLGEWETTVLLGGSFLLITEEETALISSAAVPEASPAPAILPSLCSSREEARSLWVHFAELLGFHLSA